MFIENKILCFREIIVDQLNECVSGLKYSVHIRIMLSTGTLRHRSAAISREECHE